MQILNIKPDQNLISNLSEYLLSLEFGAVLTPSIWLNQALSKRGVNHKIFVYDQLHEALPLLLDLQTPLLKHSPKNAILLRIAELIGAKQLNLDRVYQDICFCYKNSSNDTILSELDQDFSLLRTIISTFEEEGILVDGFLQKRAVRYLKNNETKVPVYLIMPQFSGKLYEQLIPIAMSDPKHKIMTIGYSHGALYEELFQNFKDIEIGQLRENQSSFDDIEALFKKEGALLSPTHKIVTFDLIKATSEVDEAAKIANAVRGFSDKKVAIVANSEVFAYQIELALKAVKSKTSNWITPKYSKQNHNFLQLGYYLIQGNAEIISNFLEISEDIDIINLKIQHALFQKAERFLDFFEIHNNLYSSIFKESESIALPVQSYNKVSTQSYIDLISSFFQELIVDKSSDICILPLVEAVYYEFDVIFIAGLNHNRFVSYSNNCGGQNRDSDALIQAQSTYQFACCLRGRHLFLSFNEVADQPLYWIEILQSYNKAAHDNSSSLISKIESAPEKKKGVKPAITLQRAELPTKITVTSLERLIKDPYSYYIKDILKLSETLEEEGETARLFGIILHQTLAEIGKTNLPKTMSQYIEKFLEIFFEQYARNKWRKQNIELQIVNYFWPHRLKNIAEWMFEYENDILATKAMTFTEVDFCLNLENQGIPGLELVSRIDRIDVLNSGVVNIIDYKSGSIPTTREISIGHSPQLLLEGLVFLEGNSRIETLNQLRYDGIALYYIGLTGRQAAREIKKVEFDLENIRDNLKELISMFWKDQASFFVSSAFDQYFLSSSYKHLLRVNEWYS